MFHKTLHHRNIAKTCLTSIGSLHPRKPTWPQPTSFSWWTWTKPNSTVSLTWILSLFNTFKRLLLLRGHWTHSSHSFNLSLATLLTFEKKKKKLNLFIISIRLGNHFKNFSISMTVCPFLSVNLLVLFVI